jgi:dolichol-phosphate mannosyltransferase
VTESRRVLIVIPTYNEAANITALLNRLEGIGPDLDVLVVDDSSPDGTGDLVAQRAAETERVHLLSRADRAGLGTAYVEGFRWALARDYDAIVEMDADLSHDPADVPRLVDALGGADLAVGSRYVPGGRVRNWGTLRRALSRAGNLYARGLMGWGVRDATSGFRAYSPDVLRKIDVAGVSSEGYAFQIEMVRRVRLAGGRVTEIPITFSERSDGRSKMSRRIVLEALWRVPVWAAGDLWARLRRKPSEGP